MVAQKPSLQEVRNARAQTGRFTFRKMYVRATIHGQPAKVGVIYVFSGQSVYTITPGKHGPRCCCMDFIKRCAGTKLECKHIVAAREWHRAGCPDHQQEQEQEEPAAEPAPEPTAAQIEVPAAPAAPAVPIEVPADVRPALPIVACACCGTLLPADEAIATVRRRDGSPAGHVCRDSAGCLARRQGPAPEAAEPLETPAARRARIVRDAETLWEPHAPRA